MRLTYGQRPLLAGVGLAVALALVPISAQQAPEKVDFDAIYRIKDEGFQRSKVMEITSWLTDVYGPRLTNSPGFRKAGEWAVSHELCGRAEAMMREQCIGVSWELVNIHGMDLWNLGYLGRIGELIRALT